MKFITLFSSVSLFAMSLTSCSPKGAAATSTTNSNVSQSAADNNRFNATPGSNSTRKLSNGMEMRVRTLPQEQQMQKSK